MLYLPLIYMLALCAVKRGPTDPGGLLLDRTSPLPALSRIRAQNLRGRPRQTQGGVSVKMPMVLDTKQPREALLTQMGVTQHLQVTANQFVYHPRRRKS